MKEETRFFARPSHDGDAVDLVRDLAAMGLEPFRLSPLTAIALGKDLIVHGRAVLNAAQPVTLKGRPWIAK